MYPSCIWRRLLDTNLGSRAFLITLNTLSARIMLHNTYVPTYSRTPFGGLRYIYFFNKQGTGRSSEVRAFAHGVMGRRIDPSLGGPIELFLVPASAPRLV